MTVSQQRNILTVLTNQYTFISVFLQYIHQIHRLDVIQQCIYVVYTAFAACANCNSTYSVLQHRIYTLGLWRGIIFFVIAKIHARGFMCVCLQARARSRHQLLGANSSLDNTAVATHQCCLGCTIKTHTSRKRAHRQPCTCKRTLKPAVVFRSLCVFSPRLSVFFCAFEEPSTQTLLFTQAIFTYSLPHVLHMCFSVFHASLLSLTCLLSGQRLAPAA